MKYIFYMFLLISIITFASGLELTFCGDVMLGNWMNEVAYREGFDYPFKEIKPLLAGSDMAFCNLECPLTTSTVKMVEKKYIYRADTAFAGIIADAGFDIVSLANNHILDFGEKGLYDTITQLKKHSIRYCGAGDDEDGARKPAAFDVDGVRIKVLAYSGTFPEEFWATDSTAGTAFQHLEHVKSDIISAKKDSSLVFVSFHFGREGTDSLRPYQPMLARAAIDTGADGVIGHHPHVLQPIEIYKGKPIFYSLGNCLFSTYSTTAKTSIIPKLVYSDILGKLEKIIIHPIIVDNYKVEFQTRFAEDSQIIDYLNAISAQFKTTIDFDEANSIGVINIK